MTKNNDLPQPGTDEPDSAPEGDAGSGPGNVSVDEPTAGALDDDAGTPGGDESDAAADDDDSTSGSDNSTSGDEDSSDN